MIHVRIPASMREHSGGQAEIELSGETVSEALEQLLQCHPALAERLLDEQSALLPYVNLFMDNQDIRDLNGLDTPLREGCELLIVSAVAGG